jgi:G3E family GTPase
VIRVNLITGFLGTGKTTLIHRLLKQRPGNESWAVLVNEFGEAGMDAALLDAGGVAVEEIASGCLCCVAGPAFSVGLNRLIREHRPDRILIEPSGLGHPARVLEQLRSPLYRDILRIQATLCVMDARHLASPRHREHPNFIDQIHLADVLVANKADHYGEADEQALLDFVAALDPPKARLLITRQGQADAGLLDLPAGFHAARFPEAHTHITAHSHPAPTPGETAWLQFEGQADGYHRVGWQLGRQWRFPRAPLLALLDSLSYERIKGVFRCPDGDFGYNRAGQDRTLTATAATQGSRLQLIDPHPLDAVAIDTRLRAFAGKATSNGAC